MDNNHQTISQMLSISQNQIEKEHCMNLAFYGAVHVLNFIHKNSITDVNGTVQLSRHTSLCKSLSDAFLRALLLNADI